MKRSLIVFTAMLCVVAMVWVLSRPMSPAVGISFRGYTNGVVGTIAPTFRTLATNNEAAIQTWLAAGTNGAIFTVTNQHRFAISIFPVAHICTSNAAPVQAPLLNAPTWSGISLAPGQVSTIQVAMLSHSAPWQLVLSYHREQSHAWTSAMTESLTSALKKSHGIVSDWVYR
jgi:hypothetical protein